jgi:hypothetical protein
MEPEEITSARQRLRKEISRAMNTHTTITELIDAVFYAALVISYTKHVAKGKHQIHFTLFF